jgi:hypothetical protein
MIGQEAYDCGVGLYLLQVKFRETDWGEIFLYFPVTMRNLSTDSRIGITG